MVKIDKNASSDVEKIDLFSFFSGEKYLSRYLNKLASADIFTVGDMASSDKDIFAQYPTSERNRQHMTQTLAKVGVHIS